VREVGAASGAFTAIDAPISFSISPDGRDVYVVLRTEVARYRRKRA
jgi:hypothetical protein